MSTAVGSARTPDPGPPDPSRPDPSRPDPTPPRRHARTRQTRHGARRGSDPLPWAIAITAITVGLWAMTGGLEGLLSSGIDATRSIGRLAGLIAALGALGGLVLAARPRWLERRAGLDRLIGWHRVTGIAAAAGTLLHVVASLAAAGGGPSQAWSALVDLVGGTDWFVAALVAAILFAVVSLTSWRRIRQHLNYETWHVIHLAGYLAVALAFPHAVFSGTTMVASTAGRWWWIALYLGTAAIVLHGRVGGILASVLRPRTQITRIIPEAPGVASLVITGPGVDSLGARPGQFVGLRVLTADLWWQAHPYSLSAAPAPGALRLTIKALGDGSARTLQIPEGTRVLLEGPYGALDIEQAQGLPVLLVGAGVGLAPMRALLEQCDAEQSPIVLARAHSLADLPFAGELTQLARARGGVMLPVTGPRSRFRSGNPFSAEAMVDNIPDVGTRVAFVCGPTALQQRVCRELERAGVPRDRIHCERFAW